jgi:exopolysaccharide biosynthesis protein
MKSIRTIYTTLFLCVVLNQAFGSNQNKDSLALVQGAWVQEVILHGVTLKEIRFEQNELFSSNQCLHLIEIEPGAAMFVIVAEPLLTTTVELAQTCDAVAAVNGSFFKFNNEPNTEDYNSVDYLRINNQRLAGNTYTETGQRQRHQEAAVAILDGTLSILKATTEVDWEEGICGKDVLSSGPLLAIDGCVEALRDESFYTTRHPRTVVAKKWDGTVILFVVDGRHEMAEGMSLDEAQKCLLWLGAKDILNFDGGGSSTMYVKGKEYDGVVNHPSDNQQYDHLGSRKVANALCVTRLYQF